MIMYLMYGEVNQTVQGNCTGPIDEALNDVLAGAPLLPLSKGQCLLVNNGNMTSSFGDWWADNIYMRYASQGDPTPGGGNVRVLYCVCFLSPLFMFYFAL